MIRIEGAEQIARALQELPAKVGRNYLRGALRAAAAVYRDRARQEAPVRSGALRRSIRISTRSRGALVTASVKIGGKLAPHAILVHGGTRPHTIRARHKGMALLNTVRSTVEHPGARANPFMDRAYRLASVAAVEAAQQYLVRRIAK